MSDPFRNLIPGTLTHLLWMRYHFFNTGKNLTTQYARAYRYLNCKRWAKEAVETHGSVFFCESLMFDQASTFDRQTLALWEGQVCMGLGGRAQKTRFFNRRLLVGIDWIRSLKRKFDLRVSARRAFFGFYLESLRWFVLDELRDHQPMDDQCMVDSAGSDPPSLTLEAIRNLAIRDLPERQRPFAERISDGEDFENESPAVRRYASDTRRDLRLLFSTHLLAQTTDGIAVILRAIELLPRKQDRELLRRHFTVPGPGSTDEIFVGLPLDTLGTAAERADKTGDKVRRRLMRCLSAPEVAAALEEERHAALAALPEWQRMILNAKILGDRVEDDLPDWSEDEWEVEVRKALRDLRYLQELYRRSTNGKSRTAMLNDLLLTKKEQELLRLHLVDPRRRKNTLDQIAAARCMDTDRVRQELLGVAKKIIKLEK